MTTLELSLAAALVATLAVIAFMAYALVVAHATVKADSQREEKLRMMFWALKDATGLGVTEPHPQHGVWCTRDDEVVEVLEVKVKRPARITSTLPDDNNIVYLRRAS